MVKEVKAFHAAAKAVGREQKPLSLQTATNISDNNVAELSRRTPTAMVFEHPQAHGGEAKQAHRGCSNEHDK